MREALHSKGLAKSQITILDALLKLRQVLRPHLVPLDAAERCKESAKMEQLMELLPKCWPRAAGAAVFAVHQHAHLIEAELKRPVACLGQTHRAEPKRDEIIEQFTSGEVPLFLISLKAGGGLNRCRPTP